MPSPQLHVETIAFRGNDKNALPLLIGEAPVTGSEWTRAGARMPAAFVMPRGHDHISLGATFSSPDLAGQTTTVMASRLDGEGNRLEEGVSPVLRDVTPATVSFDATGHSGRVQFRVAISRREIALDRVRWQWKFHHGRLMHDATLSEHEIAIVLGAPQRPWTKETPALAGTSLPWWEVLQRACTAAQGARTLREAAVRITKAVFGGWGGPITGGARSPRRSPATLATNWSSTASGSWYLLGAPPPVPLEIVDCSDIATILSTFSSILGCPIQQVVLKDDLMCRVVRMVGHGEREWHVREFPLHEIAVGVPLGSSPEVWDGCLMVSGDQPIGTGVPTIPLLPAGLAAADYLQRLLLTKSKGFDKHVMFPPQSRPLGQLSNVLSPSSGAPPGPLALAASHGSPDVARVFAFDPKTLTGEGWRVQVETAFPTLDAVPTGSVSVGRVACTWANDPTRRVRVTLYLCPDADAARRRVLYQRGKFAPPLTPLEAGPNIAFSTLDRKTIVGATLNVAYRIIDAGGPANAESDAPGMQAALMSRLASASQPL